MNKKTEARYKARSRIIKALAHPSRLYMVDELSKGELCVCDLTELVGSDMSTVSKHLALLRQVGVVEAEKRGAQVFYRLKMSCVLKMFDCIEPILEARASEQLEVLAS